VLDWGYREWGFYPVVKANDKLADVKVWLGQAQTVSLLVSKDVAMTLPRSARGGLKTNITYNEPVQAPITKGQQLGTLTITAPEWDERGSSPSW